jgi:hypothetical protein
LKYWQQKFENKITRKIGRPSSADEEDNLDGKLHLIQAHDEKAKEYLQFTSKEN